jgi:hypothetical protein
MPEICPDCWKTMDLLHSCGANSKASSDELTGFGGDNSRLPVFTVVAAAPLAGILFDVLLPLPSSLLHSAIVSILGSAFVAMMWVAFKYEGSKSPRFYLANVKNFVYTPNLLKMYGSDNGKKVTAVWLSVIAASMAVQIFFFTPGNASYLARQVSNQIDRESGASLDVACPSPRLFFYNERIECRVKTGLLGISVPARADISPLLGAAEIKVSLL